MKTLIYHLKHIIMTFVKPCANSHKDPTLCTNYFWLQHTSPKITYPTIGDQGGKWLLFSNKENINALWTKIKTAQDQGLLGGKCEVSTVKPLGKAASGIFYIRVYTYDHKDVIDVMRVRESLRKLGITHPIHYKALYMSFKCTRGDDSEEEEEFKYTA